MEIIKYKNNEIEIDVRFDYENNTVWLNLEQISYLFNKSKSTISRKIKELIKVNNHSVVAEFATTANDNKVYKVSHYSLEIIVAIGYKTNSNEVMKFKKWVEDKLLESKQKLTFFDEKPYEIVTFVDDELQIDVNVDVDNDTVWLSQEQIAMLFDKAISTINEHIKNILEEELDENEVVRKFGKTEFNSKRKKCYSLDLILAIGYRVNSKRGILFRKWASAILKNHLTKGYSINERRCLICQENLLDLNNKVNYLISENNINKEEIKLLNTPEATFKNKLFYENKIFEGYSFVRKLLLSAKKEIIIIDGYITIEVLEMLDDIKVDIIIYTYPSATISKNDIKLFQRTHNLIINRMSNIHDRFIVVDDDVYAFGSSLKDIGKKITLVSKLETISKEMILNIEESKKVLI